MIPLTIPICEKTALVFGGWLQQFENPPDWFPKIEVKDEILVLDGSSVCKTAEILSIVSDVEFVAFDTEKGRYIVAIGWPYDGTPSIKEVSFWEWTAEEDII